MRKCGDCTLCCTLAAVKELGKPAKEACVFCKDSGCSIYATRPQSCRKFECAWHQGDLPQWMRPDKSHVMIEPLLGVAVVLALAEPGYEETWRTPAVEKALREEYTDRDIAVVGSDWLSLVPKNRTPQGVARDVRKVARSMGLVP